MSNTINSFQNYLDHSKSDLETFQLNEFILNFSNLIKPSLKDNGIELIMNCDDDITLTSYPNCLTESMLGIYTNTKEAMAELQNSTKLLFITTKTGNKKITIEIKDNAGGILDNIITKIFEPYTTSKHQSQGKGMGLHEIYKLVSSQLKGTIKASNSKFTHNGKEYTGASFIITIPIK